MMPRTRTIVIAVCAATAGLAIAWLLVARVVLTEARMRVTAATYVKAQTGRDLLIAGPIALSFVPWLGAELHDVTIGGGATTPAPAAVRFSQLGLKVRLWPLIRGRIDVGGVHARGGRTSMAGYDLSDVDLTTGAFGDERKTDLSLEGNIAPHGSRAVPLSLSAGIVLDIASQALELSDVKGAVGGLSFTGEAHGQRILDAPAVKARFQTNTFDLRRLLVDLGTPYPTVDQKALTSASLSGATTLTQSSLELTDLVLTLDGSRMTGRAKRTGTVGHEWRALLQADTFDLDRYLPGPVPAASPAAGDQYAGLRDLIAEAKIDVRHLKVYGLQLSNATAVLTARNGVVLVSPARAALYGGTGELSGTMDVRGTVPWYHAEGRLGNVAVQPLLEAAQSMTALAGTGDVTFRLDASAADPQHLTRAMNGQVTMSVHDGHLAGADVEKLLAQAQAISDQIRGRPMTASSNAAARTRFSRLYGSATIDRGVARNRDLVIDAPSLKGGGAGTIDLNHQTIDYVLRASSREAGNVMVPIAISGPFASPSYSVQAGALFRDAAKQELRKQLEKRGLGGLFKKKPGG